MMMMVMVLFILVYIFIVNGDLILLRNFKNHLLLLPLFLVLLMILFL